MDNEELVTNDDIVTESMTLTDSDAVSLQQIHEDLLILMFIILFVFVYERVRIAIRSLRKKGD